MQRKMRTDGRGIVTEGRMGQPWERPPGEGQGRNGRCEAGRWMKKGTEMHTDVKREACTGRGDWEREKPHT